MSMVLVPSPRHTSCFLAGSYRSISSVPTAIVDVWPVTLPLLHPPHPLPHPPGAAAVTKCRQVDAFSLSDNGVIADVEVRALVDPGQAFLRELFVHCTLNGLIDQLIRHRAAGAGEVYPLVGFVGRKVGAAVIVVMNILAVGASD